MTKKVLTEVVESDDRLKKEVQTSIKTYMSKECSIEELEKLDDKFILTLNYKL